MPNLPLSSPLSIVARFLHHSLHLGTLELGVGISNIFMLERIPGIILRATKANFSLEELGKESPSSILIPCMNHLIDK